MGECLDPEIQRGKGAAPAFQVLKRYIFSWLLCWVIHAQKRSFSNCFDDPEGKVLNWAVCSKQKLESFLDDFSYVPHPASHTSLSSISNPYTSRHFYCHYFGLARLLHNYDSSLSAGSVSFNLVTFCPVSMLSGWLNPNLIRPLPVKHFSSGYSYLPSDLSLNSSTWLTRPVQLCFSPL